MKRGALSPSTINSLFEKLVFIFISIIFRFFATSSYFYPMKKLLLISTFLALAFTSAIAQPIGSNAIEAWGQLWMTTNASQYGSPTASQLGFQLDTGTNTTPFSVYTTKPISGKNFVDTFVFTPINGYGSIGFMTSLLKVTNTPTVTVTYIGSYDAVHWAPLPGVSVQTITPTSLTVPSTAAVVLPLGGTTGGAMFRYFGATLAGSATSTYSSQLYWYFVKPTAPAATR